MPENAEITALLNDWSHGDQQALESLTPLVYDELRSMASRLFVTEKGGHTLQPTALVHEVFEKLVDVDVSWQNRAHFFALSARMMRRMLVNHANARGARKRGGNAVKLSLDEGLVADRERDADFLDLDEALTRLAGFDARKAELIELQYFGGLTYREMEEVTNLSSSTLDRELRLARAWLKDQLSSD